MLSQFINNKKIVILFLFFTNILQRTKLLMYGGSDIPSAVKIILTKVISNQLGTKITLTGLSAGRRPAPDKKLGLLKTKFFGLLLGEKSYLYIVR